jgi:hypothetical protein
MTMRTLSIGILSVALAAAPLTTASAHGFHHHGFGLIGGLFHAAGAVVVGAAMVATAPIRIVADAAGAGRGGYDDDRGGYRGRGGYDQRDPRDAYYGGRDYGYAPRGYYNAPPPDRYARSSYGPRDDGYYGRRDDYGPPPDYRQSRDQYYGPRDDDDRYARRDPYYGQY